MLRVIVAGIWTVANTLLSRNQPSLNDQPSTSKWHTIGNFLYSILSKIGVPLVQTMTENETLYECVNTLLANRTTTTTTTTPPRTPNEHHSNLSRHSRPNFRRRANHHIGNVRILKPTIHIHIH